MNKTAEDPRTKANVFTVHVYDSLERDTSLSFCTYTIKDMEKALAAVEDSLPSAPAMMKIGRELKLTMRALRFRKGSPIVGKRNLMLTLIERSLPGN